MNSFWAYQWIDFHNARNIKDVRALLSDKVALNHLHELAQLSKTRPCDIQVELVAGRGIDLSGQLDCMASECRTRQVDDLLRHAWHYFDRILVDDALYHGVTHHWNSKSAKFKEWLTGHFEVLLYVRSIGAEDLLVFEDKHPACQLHLAQHAREAGLPTDLYSDEKLLEDLSHSAKISMKRSGPNQVDYAFVHPRFEHTVWGKIENLGPGGQSEGDLQHVVILDVAQLYIAHLISDIRTARHFGASLGSTLWFHSKTLRRSSDRLTPAEVAFSLELPVLNNIPIELLVKIRKNESDAFQRFRDSLRRGITERLRAGATENGRLTEEIRRDLIEPELLRIKQRLATAERAFSRKTLVGFGLGSLVTTCGLLAGISPPLAVIGGIGTMTTVAATAAQKEIDERRDVSLSEMYFLWKAATHSKHRKD